MSPSIRSLVAVACLLGTMATAHATDERGRYLVRTSGCGDCHTPMKMGPTGPAPDVSRGLSGHPEGMPVPPPPTATGPWIWGGLVTNTAFWGPWGISYSANLTPDKATGIGAWKEHDFVAAMRTGKHLGVGRPILPPMPWPAMSTMTDADLKAIYRFLMREPAIANKVPDAVVAAH